MVGPEQTEHTVGLDTHIEGTLRPFPELPEISTKDYNSMKARYKRNPEFVLETYGMMEDAGDHTLIEAIDAVWEDEGQNDEVIRGSTVMWRLLHGARTDWPAAQLEPNPKFKPHDPYLFKGENPHIMEGLKGFAMRLGDKNAAARVRGAMLVYEGKRDALKREILMLAGFAEEGTPTA